MTAWDRQFDYDPAFDGDPAYDEALEECEREFRKEIENLRDELFAVRDDLVFVEGQLVEAKSEVERLTTLLVLAGLLEAA